MFPATSPLALPPLRLALLMWSMAAAFYLFGFFQRVTPAVLTQELMHDFSLSAAALGHLSAFYFYCYAALQIPTGLMNDRFGPRRLLAVGALVAGVGALLFATATNFQSAALGRGLIGGAVAVAWVSMLKLLSHWVDPKKFASITGISLAVGTMGAVLAGLPLRALVDSFGWRWVLGASGAFALLLALLIVLIMRDDPSERGYASFAPTAPEAPISVWRGLLEIWRYRNTLLLVLIPSGTCGAFLTFTGLWGVPFLVQQHHLSTRNAALIISAMLIAFSMGGVVWGNWSDRIASRKTPLLLGSLCAMLSFCVLASTPTLRLEWLVPILVVGAFGAGSMVVAFAYSKESVPTHLSGTVNGAVNMGVMLGPLTQQPFIGTLLDAYWQGGMQHGTRIYDTHAWKVSFAFLFAWLFCTTLCVLFTRDTHARQVA